MGNSGARKGVRQTGNDAVQLAIDYVKQETLGPLKAVGRYLVFGITASLALSLGTLFVLLGVLRLLQDETGSWFTGDLSWLPYLIVTVLGLGVILIAAWRITTGPATPRLPARGTDTTDTSGAATDARAQGGTS